MTDSRSSKKKLPLIVGLDPLLDRQGTSRAIDQEHGTALIAFAELIDEGVRLLQRGLHAQEDRLDIPETVLLAGLYRQFLAMMDTVHLCISNGAIQGAQTPLRSSLEMALFVSFILEDKEERALRYYVGDIRRRERALQFAIPKTRENKESVAALAKYPELLEELRKPETILAAQDEVARLRAHLYEPRFRSINQAFEDLRAESKNRQEPAWYRVRGGPRDLRTLSKSVGLGVEYLRIYGDLSEVIHGKIEWNYEIPERGSMILKPLRSIDGLDVSFNLGVGLTLRMHRVIQAAYRPEENFAAKYVSEYQKRLRMPEIEVEWIV